MKKLPVYLLPVAVLAASCSGGADSRQAKGSAVYGGTLRYNETDKLQTLYPINITDAISWHAASQIYEGLVKFDPRTLEIIPCIAEKWEPKNNNTTYVFTLRKGVKFHDDACFSGGTGRELTAADVKYSFEQLCTKTDNNFNFSTTFKDRVKGANAFYAKTGQLDGVKVIDDHTVQIDLEQPNNNFLGILSNPACCIIPKEAVEKYGEKMHIGTGPFRFSEMSGDTSKLVLVANPNYYGKDSLGNQLPFLDTVKITYIDNKQKELEEWEKGNLDFMWGLNPDAKKKFVIEHIKDFATPPVYEMDSKGELGVQFYEFNTTRKPFNDKRVRQAFCYAINRKNIVNNVLGGEAYSEGSNGITPPALTGYNVESLKGYKDSIAYAQKLLADAGYPEGKDFPAVTLTINASPTAGESRNSLVAIEIQNQLKQNLGVNVTISRVTFAQKQEASKYARSDMFRSAWIADYPSPESFLSLFYGRTVPDSTDKPSYPNTSRWHNAKFDSLYDAGVRAATKEEANRLFLQAEQIMIDEAPAMILWYDGNDKLTYSYVHNFYLNPMRYFDFSQVYIKHDDKAEKDSAKKENK